MCGACAYIVCAKFCRKLCLFWVLKQSWYGITALFSATTFSTRMRFTIGYVIYQLHNSHFSVAQQSHLSVTQQSHSSLTQQSWTAMQVLPVCTRTLENVGVAWTWCQRPCKPIVHKKFVLHTARMKEPEGLPLCCCRPVKKNQRLESNALTEWVVGPKGARTW
jgi:hypothetical protein